MTKPGLKVGTALYVSVGQEHINDSDPCNKDNCMLTRALTGYLVNTYGGKAGDYRVKSTNHGTIFRLNGREVIAVFDTKTGMRIFNYDRVFRARRSKEAARKSVKPFKARVIIEATRKLAVWPPMNEETKQKLRSLPKKNEIGICGEEDRRRARA